MGALAGPACVAVVVFPTNAKAIKGVTDSKRLSPNKRTELAPIIMKEATFFGIGWSHPSVIDTMGLSEAWRMACSDALEGAPKFDLLMIDGNRTLPSFGAEQVAIPKGDAKVWQIGAASIVAKVVRDVEMTGMSKHYPAYQFDKNMGYGSDEHLEALFRLGPTSYHRGSYLRKIWQHHGSKINKRLAAWQEWQKRWEGAEVDFSTLDLEY